MRAAWYERTGAARDVLTVGEMEVPEPGPGQVRVRVQVSGVNPSDVKYRGAWGGLAMEYPRVVPHNDGAGVIDAVGEGVPAVRVGERVWVYETQRGRPFGTAAEFAVLPGEQAVHLPDGISTEAGACLGVPAMTAHRCVFADGPVEGQTVLVSGGAGAVGYYAIQFAKWGGATVISTVSSPQKAAVAREAGADHTIDYKTEDVVKRVRALTEEGMDRIVEVAFSSNLALNAEVIKPSGVIATYSSDEDSNPRLPFLPLQIKNTTVHFVLVYAMTGASHRAAAADITACLLAGVLRHPTLHAFSLAQIAEAHEAVEGGRIIGKAVVQFD